MIASTPIQPEAVLEANLVKQLQGMGYKAVEIAGEHEMLMNLQQQLQEHNNSTLSDSDIN